MKSGMTLDVVRGVIDVSRPDPKAADALSESSSKRGRGRRVSPAVSEVDVPVKS